MLHLKCAIHNYFIVFLLIISLSASAEGILVLNVIVNSEDVGDSILVLGEDGDIWMSQDDFTRTRLRPGLGETRLIKGKPYISLRSISGLKYAIDETTVTLNIEASGNLFAPQSIDISAARNDSSAVRSMDTAFLNYAVLSEGAANEHALTLSSELGGRVSDYVGVTSFAYEQNDDRHSLVRNMTWLRTDDRESLRTTIIGDNVSLAGGVRPSSLLLGGLSISKNFSMSPYYSTAPSLNIQGVITSPSDVEVLVDGYRVSRQRLAPGEFTLRNVPSQAGYGVAEVVIRDAYGREEVISENFYIAQQLLKEGLSEYSHSIGFLRKNFGDKSFSYGDPVLLSSFRRGLSDRHTLGYSLNLSRDHVDASPAAAIGLNTAGVLGIALGLSHENGRDGISGALDYIFQSRFFNSTLSLKGYSEDYSTLTLGNNDSKPELQLDAMVGLASRPLGSVALKYTVAHNHRAADTAGVGLFYNRSLGDRWYMFVTADRVQEQNRRDSYNVFLGFNLSLDNNVSGNLGYTKTEDSISREARVQKNVSAGRGAGFLAEYEETAGNTSWRGEASYDSDIGIYGVRYQDNGNYQLSAAGGVGYLDHSLFFSRPLADSYAKVDVGGIPGVRVYYYGHEVAVTDKVGVAILPTISSFHDNKIEISEADIPFSYNIPTLTAYMNPPYRSGTLIHFAVTKVRGISGRLVIENNGTPTLIEYGEMNVRHGDKTYQGMVGRGGEFYIENLPTGRHSAEVVSQDSSCHAWLDIPETSEALVEIGEVACLAN